MNRNLVISTKTLLTAFGLVVLAILLYQIRDVIMLLSIAFILALSIETSVKRLVNLKLPRWFAVSIVFVLTVGVIATFITVALPAVIVQTTKLITNIPQFLGSIVQSPEFRNSLSSSISDLTLGSGGVFAVTLNFFSNAFNVITVLVFTLYLSFDLPNVKKRFLGLFADDLRDHVDETWNDIEFSLSNWIKGQLLLMIVVGAASYVGLLILRMPYALPLALIAGFLEVVPVLGPVISTVIAGVVGFSINPLSGILVVALFIGIQQLENNLLVPRVMQKVIGFNPIVTMVALLVGAKLYGVVGALISLPVALILIVVVHKVISLDLEN